MKSKIEKMIRSTITQGIRALAQWNRRQLPKPKIPHPYLTGIHRPMSEEMTITELAVVGNIPAGLDGQYLRIGPNPIAADPASYHWFGGDGMIHGLRIERQRPIWYRNRWIRSNAVAKARKVMPAPGPRHIFDTVNTNIAQIAGRTFALVESGSYPVEVSDRLDGQTFNPFDGTLAGSFTAHPHRDPLTGEHHAVCYEGSDPSKVRHVVVDAAGQVVREEPIAVKNGPMIHDCAMTARYVIIFDLPVTFSMSTLIAGYALPYRWNSKHQARVGLMPRKGSQEDIIWCPIDPAFVFHVANAYDDSDGKVVLDVCAYDTMFAKSTQGPDALCRGLERWTIDPQSRAVHIRTIDNAPQDFPRIDERRFGQSHRYAYAIALPNDSTAPYVGSSALYRHDLDEGTRQIHDFGPGKAPGEFVFVPKAANSGESEGWMIGLVIDMISHTTDLVILDAEQFEGEPVASIRIPHRIPFGFHGNWIPSAVAAV